MKAKLKKSLLSIAVMGFVMAISIVPSNAHSLSDGGVSTMGLCGDVPCPKPGG